MKSTLFFSLLMICTSLWAMESDMNPRLIEGYKWPNSPSEGNNPIKSKALLPSPSTFIGGHNHLVSHTLPSPYQDDAGSCLFMSHTGAVEILLSRHTQKERDLSERYFMNLSKAGVGDQRIENWRTDTIFRLNETAQIFLNHDYPFTKGWYKYVNDQRVDAKPSGPGAFYGVKYNWVLKHDEINANPVVLPRFNREVIFADPSMNQWNVNVAPENIVDKVKEAFSRRKAPVIVIYNHTGFWHAVAVVGYNDNASSGECPFMSSYKEKMDNRAIEIREEADATDDPEKKRKLLRKAKKFNRRGQSVHEAYLAKGGCKGKGVFYVRDSIYPDKSRPLYDYDPATAGEEEHMNAPIILREYEWLERVSNHVYQLYIE